MEKNLTEKKVLISKPKTKFSQNNLIFDLSKIIKSQKTSTQRILKKESNSKIINNNNNSLTGSSRKKVNKKQKKILPRGTILNLKKTIPQTQHNCLINLIKKKQLSCTQKSIDKITNKIIYNLKNLSSNKKTKNDSSKCSDSENDEHNTRFFIPNITTAKKKRNYFYDYTKRKIKSRNLPNISNNFSMKLTFEKTKSRLVLFPKLRKDCKNIPNEKKTSKKKIIKTKNAAKKNEENKENYNNNCNCKDNNKIPNSNNIILKIIKQQKNTRNYKKIIEPELNQFDEIFNSIDDEHRINDININIMNSKTFEYTNLINSLTDKQDSQITKNINISFVDKETVNETTINNNTTILNSNSDYISENKANDSPENVTDREDDKFTLPIHKINHHYNAEKKRYKKFERKSEQYFSINNLNNIDEDCDCNKHKRNVPFVNINNISKDNISSYKNNINKFKNFTAGRKTPISLIISPNQRNNLFKVVNINNKRNKDINLILYNLLINKENNDIKKLIDKYLDIKSLLKLSSLNKIFYKNYRIFLYKYLYNKSLASNKSIQEKNTYIMKIINSSFQYSNLNNLKEIKDIYKKYKFKSKYDIEIIRDLTRTYPNDNSFSKDSKNYKKLYNILTCYSNYNKSIGYTQGLNFIGANIIYIFESEEKCFLFLDSLINRFELDNIFGINNKNLITKLMFYSNVLNKYIPDIISFFNKLNINHDFFSTGWILTLFSNSMKKECLITSWAFMIIFGWKFFYSFVIQILIWYKKDIFNSNLNELCYKMKSILSDDKFYINYNNIIKNTFIFMLNNIIL